jgi:hypothetical protein
MASAREQEQGRNATKQRGTPTKQGDGDQGTRSGQPNPENVPSHPNEHKSGYGGEGGSPRTDTNQRETPKKA